MSAIAQDARTEQRRRNLFRANEARVAMAQLRREIETMTAARGRQFVAEQLLDPNAVVGAFPVERLLHVIPFMGPTKTRKLLRDAQITGGRRVRDLTPLQRQAVAFRLLEGVRHA